jgi:hypothetical protein
MVKRLPGKHEANFKPQCGQKQKECTNVSFSILTNAVLTEDADNRSRVKGMWELCNCNF